MVRITDAVKNSIAKESFPKSENGEEEPNLSPFIPGSSTVRVSELFKEKKVVAEDREIYRRLYDNLQGVIREVIERPKNNEVFEIKDAVDIVERIINQLDSPNSSIFIELVLNSSSFEDNYLYAHSANVCLLALRLGKALNMSKSELIDLGIGALLHDIGMLKISQEIVTKTSHLTDKEMDIVKTHPSQGYDWLKNTNKKLAESISYIVFHHHEKVNGQGYPQGLSKEQIHKFAKIIRLVDSYEAMTHRRSWRKSLLPIEAIKNILDNEKDFYEDSLIRLLLREISVYPVGGWVKLNTREVGKIVKINPKAPMRPTVEIILDPDGFKLEKPKLINLMERPLIYIEKACKSSEENPEEIPKK